MTPIQQLYKYFSDLMKPTGAQFRALIDSFWHKAEKIPISSIEGLDKLIEGTASDRQLQNHINDTNAHKEVLDKKVDKVAGKILSSNDFTNELRQKLEGLQQVDTSGLLPKGGYTGTAQDLKNLIDNINRILQSDDTDLDQLQEIVNYIKQNKHILSTLGISNIAGLVDALAAKAEKDHTHNWDDIQGKPNNLATTEDIKEYDPVGNIINGTRQILPNEADKVIFVTNSVDNCALNVFPNRCSVSFLKTFDGGHVNFTCLGKNIIYARGINEFNGAKGSTAVVSIHENDCYVRISNV